MKLIVAVLALVLLLFVDMSLQISKVENCPSDIVLPSSMLKSCTRVLCDAENNISAVGCANYRCAEGKRRGYKQEDNSKIYPACCGGEICAD